MGYNKGFKNFATIALISTMILSTSASALAVGELMINSSAGRTYAGFGYTHGYIPVTEQYPTGDNDIMRYEINHLRPAETYYTQDDLKYHNGEHLVVPNKENQNQDFSQYDSQDYRQY